jgi:hypothetical protein
MRSLLALLALGLLVVGVTACGGSNSSNNAASASRASSKSPASSGAATATHPPDTTSPAAASPASSPVLVAQPTRHDREKYDRDEDDHTNVPDDNNPSPSGFLVASPADKRAITALVKRYYAAALKGDGASGCSLIDPGLVKGIPLDYGKLGPSFLRRAKGTCPAVMSLYFKHEHRKLTSEVPQLDVPRVSVNGNQGVAFMRFGRLHERFISTLRKGSTWKIASVLDGELE